MDGRFQRTPLAKWRCWPALFAFLMVVGMSLGGARAAQAFSISGRITTSAGVPVPGVKVESTGEVNDGVFTNANGEYTLTGAANGSYVVTPEPEEGMTFAPASRTVTVSGANVSGVDFIASGGGAGGGFTISGRVVNGSGAGVSGVKIESTGEVFDGVFTNANGEYTLTGAANGTYVVAPDVEDGLTFTPSSRTVTVSNANVTGVNFVASGGGGTGGGFTISGRIVNGAGNPVSGVKIESTGEVNDSIFTNANGEYTLTGAAPGTYVVTPDVENGITFTPSSRTVTVTDANVTGVNFVASGGGVGGSFSVSGRVVNASGVGVAGVRIESTGEVADGILTNAQGFYTLTGVTPGTYTITPDKENVGFRPVARSVQVSNANVGGVNFVASGGGAGNGRFTISGRVVNGAGQPVAGVRIESSGEVVDGVLTNAQGFYTLTGAAPGTYIVTPDKNDVRFNPAARQVRVTNANVGGINFVAGVANGGGAFIIQGRVVNQAGVGVAGVRIESTGEVNDGVLTNAQGFYTLTGAAPGTYIITPDKGDVGFSPSSRTAKVVDKNVGGINFVASGGGAGAGTFTISGRVTNAAGAGVANVRIESTGEVNDGVLTNTQGFYTLTRVGRGTYIITPDRSDLAFTPAQRTVTVNNANATGVNFSAAPR